MLKSIQNQNQNQNQLPESYNFRETSSFRINDLISNGEILSTFDCYKGYLFMLDTSQGGGNVVVVDVVSRSVVNHVFVNKNVTGIAIDKVNNIVFVTSPKKLYRASAEDVISKKHWIFSEINYEKRLQDEEYFNGAITLNVEDRELYIVVKNLKTKECKIIHYHNDYAFIDNVLSTQRRNTKMTGYDCVQYTEIIPCIHDNETSFTNIHLIQYVKHSEELIAFACVSGNAYVMTRAGIYIKTIQGLNPKILKGVYDENTSIFAVSHIDHGKISLYHYTTQEMRLVDEIPFKNSSKQRCFPLGIENETGSVYVYDCVTGFTVYSYGRIVHSLLTQCWEKIKQNLGLYLDAKLSLSGEVIQRAQEQAAKSVSRLAMRCSYSLPEPQSFIPMNLSLFINGKVPLTEILTFPRPQKSQKRERVDISKITFSLLNDDCSTVKNMCKKMRVSRTGTDNVDINVTSFLKLVNPDSFLTHSSPLDESWETKDLLFLASSEYIWSLPSPTSETLLVAETD
jgi:hypothetical protein